MLKPKKVVIPAKAGIQEVERTKYNVPLVFPFDKTRLIIIRPKTDFSQFRLRLFQQLIYSVNNLLQ